MEIVMMMLGTPIFHYHSFLINLFDCVTKPSMRRGNPRENNIITSELYKEGLGTQLEGKKNK